MNTNKNTGKENQNTNIENAAERSCAKSSKKKWIIAILVIVVVAVAASLTWYFTAKPEQSKEVVYSPEEVVYEPVDESAVYVTSDGALYYYDDEADKSVFLSDTALKYPEYDNYNYRFIHVTNDKRNIYYMESVENTCDYICGTLCARSLENQDEAPIVIDTNVKDYIFVKDDKNIVYIKYADNSGMQLYEYDVLSGEKTLVSDSDDYYMLLEKASEDKYCYLVDDELFEKDFGQEKKFISDEVSSFVIDDENGNIYISKADPACFEIKLSDVIEFDMTKEEFHSAEIWDSLETEVYERFSTGLYVYDGTEVKQISNSGSFVSYGDVFAYYGIGFSLDEKIKVSEITEVYDVHEYIEDRIYRTICIYENGTSKEVYKSGGAGGVSVNHDNTEVIFIDHSGYTGSSVYDEGDLYRVSLTGKNAGKPVLVESNVYDAYFEGNDMVYAKDLDYETLGGDFYVNGKLVCKDAAEFHYSNGKSAYMTDYVYNFAVYTGSGNFAVNIDGKEEKISDELVTTPMLLNDGAVAYITFDDVSQKSELHIFANGEEVVTADGEYSKYSYSGRSKNADAFYYVDGSDLYVFKGGEIKLIAENVDKVVANTIY